jgi:hypothetical protein
MNGLTDMKTMPFVGCSISNGFYWKATGFGSL